MILDIIYIVILCLFARGTVYHFTLSKRFLQQGKARDDRTPGQSFNKTPLTLMDRTLWDPFV